MRNVQHKLQFCVTGQLELNPISQVSFPTYGKSPPPICFHSAPDPWLHEWAVSQAGGIAWSHQKGSYSCQQADKSRNDSTEPSLKRSQSCTLNEREEGSAEPATRVVLKRVTDLCMCLQLCVTQALNFPSGQGRGAWERAGETTTAPPGNAGCGNKLCEQCRSYLHLLNCTYIPF